MRAVTIHILHIEDSELDAQLVCHTLEEAHFQFQLDWVDNFADFKAALQSKQYDLILTDYSLPDCDGLDIIKQARENKPFVPLLLVTGALGEERAIETIRAGVTDYILKTNLMRLQTSIPRALEEAKSSRDRQAAHEALRVSEERFDLAVRGSGAGIWDWPDVSRDEMWWAPRIYEMLGYTEDEIPATRSSLYRLLTAEDSSRSKTALREHFEQQNPYDIEFQILSKSGAWLWFRSRGQALFVDGKPTRMAGYIQDVTDRKAAQEMLRARQRDLIQAQEVARFGCWTYEIPEDQLYWTPMVYQLFGFTTEDFTGTLAESMTRVHPDDVTLVEEQWAHALQTGRLDYEHRLLVAGELRWVREVAEIEYDAERQPLKAIGVVHDLTSQRAAEVERRELENQLRQTQKMEAIGTLASGIAHDFNNLLASIIGYSSILDRQMEPGSKAKQDVAEVLRAADRAKQLVRQILAFSRQSEIEKAPVYLDMVVKEVLQLLRATLPTTIDVKTNISARGETVLGDTTQMHQILLNLCTNAYHAMPEGGVLKVSLQHIDLSADSEHELPAGAYLELMVEDTGHGIAPEILDKIFDPYFTTKDIDAGTGLGLSVAQGIVNAMAGKISVKSTLGAGTCFRALLPSCQQKPVLEEDLQAATAGGRGERVLFVDDESVLAQLGQELLERLGYQATTKTSSLEALEEIRNSPDTYDLLITDQTMPQMSGIELAKQVKQVAPDLPVILCSGLRYTMETEGIAETSICEVLLKTDLLESLPAILRGIFNQ